MKRILLLVFVTVLFLNQVYVNAAVYQVGTLSELNGVLPGLKPGDTVILLNGVWMDVNVLFEGNGTEANPITFKAETIGGVVFSGNSKMRIAGDYLVVNGFSFKNGALTTAGSVIEFRNGSKHARFSRLTNTSIKDYNPSDINLDSKWVSLYGYKNRVDHCSFEGKTNSGTTLVVWLNEAPDYHLIDHNYFGPRPELGFNGGETIRIGTSDWSLYSSNTIVEKNLFEACDGETEIISNKSCHNIYKYNTFLNCDGTLTLRHGDDCEVYGNFFIDTTNKKSGGVRIIGKRHKVYNNYFEGLNGDGFRAAISVVNGIPDSPLNGYVQVEDAQIGFNTIINCKQPFGIGAGKSTTNTMPPLNVLVTNNLVYCRAGNAMVRIYEPAAEVIWDGNLLSNGTSGIPANPGIKAVNISFISDGTLLRPQPDNIIANPATGLMPEVLVDIDLQVRPAVNRHVGCDQISETPVLNAPMKRTEVGVQDESETSVKKNFTESGIKITRLSKGLYQIDFEHQAWRVLTLFNIEGKRLLQQSGNELSQQVNVKYRSGTFILRIDEANNSYAIKLLV